MLEALDTDEPGDALHYSCLFSDDENLSQGLTAEIIRSQHLTERLEFLQVRDDFARKRADVSSGKQLCIYHRSILKHVRVCAHDACMPPTCVTFAVPCAVLRLTGNRGRHP